MIVEHGEVVDAMSVHRSFVRKFRKNSRYRTRIAFSFMRTIKARVTADISVGLHSVPPNCSSPLLLMKQDLNKYIQLQCTVLYS